MYSSVQDGIAQIDEPTDIVTVGPGTYDGQVAVTMGTVVSVAGPAATVLRHVSGDALLLVYGGTIDGFSLELAQPPVGPPVQVYNDSALRNLRMDGQTVGAPARQPIVDIVQGSVELDRLTLTGNLLASAAVSAMPNTSIWIHDSYLADNIAGGPPTATEVTAQGAAEILSERNEFRAAGPPSMGMYAEQVQLVDSLDDTFSGARFEAYATDAVNIVGATFESNSDPEQSALLVSPAFPFGTVAVREGTFRSLNLTGAGEPAAITVVGGSATIERNRFCDVQSSSGAAAVLSYAESIEIRSNTFLRVGGDHVVGLYQGGFAGLSGNLWMRGSAGDSDVRFSGPMEVDWRRNVAMDAETAASHLALGPYTFDESVWWNNGINLGGNLNDSVLDSSNLFSDPRVHADSSKPCELDAIWVERNSPLVDALPGSFDVDFTDADLGPWGGASPDSRYWQDADGDGTPSVYDCNEGNPDVNPNADEICDGIDNDCDGSVDQGAVDATTWFADVDLDGFGDAATSVEDCAQPTGFVADSSDCDDTQDDTFPGNTEICDGIDNDCIGVVDAGAVDMTTWYIDADSDGFGDATTSVEACTEPTGYVADSTDCDDAQEDTFPGSPEVCDGIDNDCDGDADTGAVDALTWYIDDDLDGFGDDEKTAVACTAPTNGVTNDTDCDDDDIDVFPGATEVCDGVDNDCDGDADSDAVDRLSWWLDSDGDGFGAVGTETSACTAPADHVAQGGDCADADDSVHPGADERCNGADDDCDTLVDEDVVFVTRWTDADGDGFGDPATQEDTCNPDNDHVDNPDDCDDAEPGVNPDAPETCNARDDDCNGLVDDNPIDAPEWYVDADGDGFGSAAGTVVSCEPPDGQVQVQGDCDDSDAGIYPDAPTRYVDGVDSDCDGVPVRSKLTGTGCACETATGPSPGWLALALMGVLIRRQGAGMATAPDRILPSIHT